MSAALDTIFLQIQNEITSALDDTMIELQDLAENTARTGLMSVNYQRAIPDAIVYSRKTDDGFEVIAEGDDVCFLEFGAGVHYNGQESHPHRPPEIAKIGEYGQGKGQNDYWVFHNGSHFQTTHGNPAGKFMWNAGEEVLNNVVAIFNKNIGRSR